MQHDRQRSIRYGRVAPPPQQSLVGQLRRRCRNSK